MHLKRLKLEFSFVRAPSKNLDDSAILRPRNASV